MKKCTCLLTSAVNGCWSPSETERWKTASVIPVPVSSDRRPEAKRAKSDSEHDPNTYLTPVHHRDSFVDWKMPRQILEISETSRYKKDRPIHQSQLTGCTLTTSPVEPPGSVAPPQSHDPHDYSTCLDCTYLATLLTDDRLS